MNDDSYIWMTMKLVEVRREAQKLLSKAQRAVEIAIEDSGKAALEFLQGGVYD